MVQPKCGFCQGTSFELTSAQVTHARTQLPIIHCASCGAALGALQMEDPSATSRASAQWVADRLRETEERLMKEIRDRSPKP